MSKQRQNILTVTDVLGRSRGRTSEMQAKEASDQSGMTDDQLGNILDSVTGTRQEAKTAGANDTPNQDQIMGELESKVAEVAALSENVSIKEAQLLGAAFMDGVAARASQYQASGVKVAGDAQGETSPEDMIKIAEDMGYKTAALAIENIVKNEVSEGEKLAALYVQQVKEACYNAGHIGALKVINNANI